MADKVTKRGPKAKREKPSVLANLPATRPQRLGRPRTDTPAVSDAPTPSPARTKREAPRPKPPQRKPQPSRAATRGRPAAVRPGARMLGSQTRVGDPPPARTIQAPRGREIVTTSIQAVGELAQIGLTVGGRALKRAVDRLPKP